MPVAVPASPQPQVELKMADKKRNFISRPDYDKYNATVNEINSEIDQLKSSLVLTLAHLRHLFLVTQDC
jgi:hypothetical protein